MVGEAAISLATACYGQANIAGNNGHDSTDVLYLAFTGKDAVPGKAANWGATNFDDFESSIATIGDSLVAKVGSSGGKSDRGPGREPDPAEERTRRTSCPPRSSATARSLADHDMCCSFDTCLGLPPAAAGRRRSIRVAIAAVATRAACETAPSLTARVVAGERVETLANSTTPTSSHVLIQHNIRAAYEIFSSCIDGRDGRRLQMPLYESRVQLQFRYWEQAALR